jgi:hypothetical protein
MQSLWGNVTKKVIALLLVACRLIAIMVLLVGLWSFRQTSSLAESIHPRTCQVGIYITSLRDFKLADKSFTADFRVWSVCPEKDLKPLESMEFVDAIEYQFSHDITLNKKNKSGLFSTKQEVYWSQRDITATLYHNWDVNNYPFDRHVLKISLEEAIQDSKGFVYTPDFKNSGYQRDMKTSSWKITSSTLVEQRISYTTTFGDPALSSKQGVYSRLVVSIPIRRAKIVSFFKLTAGVYVAFAVAMLSFFYDTSQASLVSARTSLLLGCLFAALVNMRAPESVIGRTEGLTLVDQIHIVAIIYIFGAAITTVYSRLSSEAGQAKFSMWRDRKLFFRAFTISFIVVNALMISYAAIIG